MSSLDTIKKHLSERYSVQFDQNVSFLCPEIFDSVADVLLYLNEETVAIKFVKEKDSVQDIENFFYDCQSAEAFPLFLFRKPNKSKVAVVCSYLNTASFAINDNLMITPFYIDKNGLQVAKKEYSIEDFEFRYKYYFNVGRPVFGFYFKAEPFFNFHLSKPVEYQPLIQETRIKHEIYDEEELETLYLSMEYDELFRKLKPVIEYGLNKALETSYCDEDMIQDVNLIIWEKFLKNEIQHPNSIGAFTISVCRFYVSNKNRKEANRKRIETLKLY